jgi:hypothetical protein
MSAAMEWLGAFFGLIGAFFVSPESRLFALRLVGFSSRQPLFDRICRVR